MMTTNNKRPMNKRFGNTIFKFLFAVLLLMSSAAMAQRNEQQHVSVGGNIFGGGKSADVKGSSIVLIDQDGAIIGTLNGETLVENTGDVYGGGEEAKVNVTATTTNNNTSYSHTSGTSTNVTLRVGTVQGNLYGGGLGVRPSDEAPEGTPADVFGPVQVTINGGTVNGSVFGCNNLFGAPQTSVVVDVLKDPNSVTMSLQNVYGGGNLAAYSNSGNNYPEVNIKHGPVGGSVFGGGLGESAEVTANPQVTIGDEVENHTAVVNGKVYGGGDEAAVNGSTTVTVQNAHSQVGVDVYGGGNQADVLHSTTVHINNGTIGQDVYGGGAFAHVGTGGNDNTTVNVLGGNVTRDVYGGGLGRKEEGQPGEIGYVAPIAAAVNGVVTVNIGALTGALENGFAPSSSVTGSATIGGSVFGCNNSNGTPKDNVTVHIYKTAHTTGVNTVSDQGFAIAQVFGGGNQAHYQPTSTGKKATVHIWTCDNTIQYLYGGGNAADVGTSGTGIKSATDVIIDGGRIEWVFGGGNGYSETNNHTNPNQSNYNPGANIFGDASVTYHAGDLIYLFGGSNQYGNISGSKMVDILSDGQCVYDNRIAELYGGNNEAPATGDVTLTMDCPDAGSYPCTINYLFGGSRKANITGNVVLTVKGGLYDYVFGGNNEGGTITGDVTLNLFGGTINEAAFGGNNRGGDIKGKITVNMLDQDPCPLVVHNIYGGGNLAAYHPTTPGAYPEVNLIHGTVSKKADDTDGNVYGGGLGEDAKVTANPVVNVGYDASMATLVGTLLPTETSLTTAIVDVKGYVYGGGQAADVEGATHVNIQKVSAEGFTASTYVRGDVYGGGALADTEGANVTLYGGCIGSIYGGGLGRLADNTNPDEPISEVEAEVNGPVQVTVNGGTVTGSVFGCNNVNGRPTSTVKVDIYGTDQPESGYAIGHVFGGGNMAAYGGTPKVKIHNCDNSIEYVYGGGNKASVVGTNVEVYGGNTIGYVFAGGNGEGVEPTTVMVSETANAYIYGGTIGQVFGGNNSSGLISGAASVTVNKQPEVANGTACAMKIGEVYGGGNYAAGNAGTIAIGCTGDLVPLGDNQHYGVDQEGIQYVYGGANQAGINSNIILNINSGIVENVFGGNNTSGTINGTIQVNINKNDNADCAQHWYIGDVYGGGNHAPYGRTPDVNIMNGTVSGNVYGGGNDITLDSPSSPAGVAGSDVEMTGGTVLGGIYGGCNLKGSVTGNSQVKINAGTLGQDASNTANIYGGGLGSNTNVKGSVTVTIGNTVGDEGATIYGDVYGGSAKGLVNCTYSESIPGLTPDAKTNVTLNAGTVNGALYGGGHGIDGASANVWGPVTVTVKGGSTNDVFGCNNEAGAPQSTVSVDIENGTINQDVYGGGNHADYNGTSDVNIVNGLVSGNVYGGGNDITDGTKGVKNSDVEMTGGVVLGGVYGGCNLNGTVTENSLVKIYGGTVGSQEQLNASTVANVFGGGLGANTKVNGKVTVTIDKTGSDAPVIYGDVYGGSALGSVNTDGNNTTTVNILDGILKTNETSETLNDQTIYYYMGGNVFGGGLGETGNADKGKVNGKVVVNIGTGTVDATNPFTEEVTDLRGNATIEGNVYGCNNSGGSPQDNVEVNIFQTAHTDENMASCMEEGCTYAIANVFGGGNEADYTARGKTASVNVFTCDNTIWRTFGGGNAAEAPHVETTIQGGRIGQVFGGGNGERGEDYGANVHEGLNIEIHGGNVGEFYGGSNQNGVISGDIEINVVNDGPCEDMIIDDFFCGGNFEDIFGDLKTTISCSDGMNVNNLYGGCNQAIIYGNVVLNLCGGTYKNVYGGSKGVANGISADIRAVTSEVHYAHPELNEGYGGNVTLNLYGGTITNVFGGSDVKGNIEGVITVNVIDAESETCPLDITNIYGGSNLTNYVPSDITVGGVVQKPISPIVNVMHAKNGIGGNVYGGSRGVEGTEVNLQAHPLVNIGYEASWMQSYIPLDPITHEPIVSVPANPKATISGSIFGGGDAANVTGNTEIRIWNNAKVFGNVYGGGNEGGVTGNTKVIVNGASQ